MRRRCAVLRLCAYRMRWVPLLPVCFTCADLTTPPTRIQRTSKALIQEGREKRNKKEISLGIDHITTGAQEYQRFRPRRGDKRKTWHTTNVKSTDDIYIKFSKTEGFTCHVVKEMKSQHKNTEHTHTHTLIDGQMPTQRNKGYYSLSFFTFVFVTVQTT